MEIQLSKISQMRVNSFRSKKKEQNRAREDKKKNEELREYRS